MTELSIHSWPKWPQVHDVESVTSGMREVMSGRVWTVRAPGDAPSVTETVETGIAGLFGARHALLVASGTVAVELGVRSLKLPAGAKVVVPALGWFATAAAVRRAGATPVFADVVRSTSCIDPGCVEDLIDDGVGAIVAVHLHCALADLKQLKEIADRRGIALVEDCAQAHGSMFAGKGVGTIGAVGCFSFNQEKLIAVGEGGCVITDDDEIYNRLYALRTDGYLKAAGGGRSFAPAGNILGGNACASEFAAVICADQIAQFAALNEIRRKNAVALAQALALLEGVTPLTTAPGTTARSWHEFAFRIDRSAFGGWPIEDCGRYLAMRLGFPIHQTDEPTQDSPLLDLHAPTVPAPASREIFESLLVFHHRILLDSFIVEALPAALLNLQEQARREPLSGG